MRFLYAIFLCCLFATAANAQTVICPLTPAAGTNNQICANTAFVQKQIGATQIVSQVNSGAGLLGGPITSTGTLSIDPSYLRSYLAGVMLSNDGTSPNSVLDISAGVAADSTDAVLIKIGAFTKSTAGAWSAGTGNDGMGNGLTIANSTWYTVCLANNSGSPDIWFDTSATCANRPSGITDTLYRRIGSFKTDGSAHILKFVQNGDDFLWVSPTEEQSSATMPTSLTALSLIGVPTGVEVWAKMRLFIDPPTAGGAILSGADASSDAVGTGNFDMFSPVASQQSVAPITARTSTSAQVRWQASQASTVAFLWSLGWTDRRGRDN